MSTPEINPKILESIGLSDNERMVFEVLLNQKLARNVSVIAKTARLPRTTVIYILRRLEQRKLAERVLHLRRLHWKYRRGLEFLIRRPVDMVLAENLVDD